MSSNAMANSILEMARGAILEQVNVEVMKVIENILDPNTEAKKKRQVQLVVDFVPSADRQTVGIVANAKSKLIPNNAIQTSLYVGADDSTGEFVAVEMTPQIPGQVGMDNSEQSERKIIRMAK